MSTATYQKLVSKATNTPFLQQKRKKLLINNQWVDAASGKTFKATDPASGIELADIACGDKEDINRAVKAARNAFENSAWRKMTASERGKKIWKLADLIEQHLEEFAYLETLDNGKPFTIAKIADIPLVVDHFRYYAGWATKIEGDTIPVSVPYAPGAQFFNYTLREPVGVVGQIIPWNFPLLMAAWKLGAALACGNCVILKPAEQTSLSSLRLGELIVEAGFPEGVVNIVTGYGEAGAALAAHPDVDKIAFTGSTEVGRKIIAASAGNLKRVSLELGGKSPNIIFADAPLDVAIKGAASAIYFNHGQCCCAGSRLYIHKKVYNEVVEGIAEYSKNIKLGHGLDPKTEMGPLVSEEQLSRVLGYIDSGKKEGAKILAGGNRSSEKTLKAGYFVEPTVFTDIKPEMKILQEEIFGPVVCAVPFSEIEEVVRQGNDTPYGLAAGIWTKDITLAHRTAAALNAGTVWINCYNIFDAASPFGGYKQSGYGREMGKYAIDLYTQVKSVWVGL
ncbi:MAG: aldehyde dehydrogenase family protein [Planctomycetota bacterium]